MKILKFSAIFLLIVFVGIQFVPTINNQSLSVPVTDFMLVNNVPKTIQNQLYVSCYDCHSNNTKYPWYNNIQPIAWFLEDHIRVGKTELNFNEWGNYSDRRKKSKLKAMIGQIKTEEMPMSSYTLLHQDAIFSESEKQDIILWITRLKENYK